MKEDRLRRLLARIMLWGVALAAVVMIAGGAIFLARHAGQKPGDHKFTGEPADLRHPVAIFKAALQGNDDSLIQAGVLLLLFNPLVRVALAAWGYAAARDRLYAGIAAFVFAVLLLSYFV
ncbi:MAG: DUF1634 domain-containing protein [Terrimicrobiaceae bacterium]|nr:DUF1634 domain-containing protein [Terrimicrobiaceae bacterium]